MTSTTPENNPPCNSLLSEQQIDPPEASNPESTSKKPHSKRQPHKAGEAVHIYSTPYTPEDIVYLARQLILCTLPHSDPGNVVTWDRTNGNFMLGIVSGMNVKTRKIYGIPYGIIPRLILVWMITEIVRTKSRRLELGNRFADFLLKLGLNAANGTGKRSDARRTREQMEKLFHATIFFLEHVENGEYSGYAEEKIQIAQRTVFWWNNKDPGQNVLFGSYIEVSEAFFQVVIKSPHPLDIRVLRHIKNSSLGIDLYTILNREAFRAMKDDKPRFLAWEWLHEQTGNEYGDIRNFRRDALTQIKAIMEVHSGLIITQQRACKGRKSCLVISNLSTPSIVPREAARVRVQTDPGHKHPSLALVPPPEPPEPPQPQPERFLKPATIAEFKQMYPRLDPYACKADFDAWVAGLAPEKQPRYYDAAFKGFARKWIVGKLIVSNI